MSDLELNLIIEEFIGKSWERIKIGWDYSKCKQTQERVADCERGIDVYWYLNGAKMATEVPTDYFSSLDKIQDVVSRLLFSQRKMYREELRRLMSEKLNGPAISWSECIDATPRMRVLALVSMIEKAPTR